MRISLCNEVIVPILDLRLKIDLKHGFNDLTLVNIRHPARQP